MTNIVVGKDRISLIESERYVAGTKNVYIMKISFSEDWEGLEKHVVFRTDNFDITVDVLSCSEQFPMPSQIFAKPTNKLQVGVYGSECGCDHHGHGRDIVLNTRWLSLGRVVKGMFNNDCCGCGSSSAPSPNTYKALFEMIQGKADRLTYEDGQVKLWSGDDILSSFEMPMCEPDCNGTVSITAPLGTIMAWSGSLDSIPEGYSLCNGQNGTVDLQNAFIFGASKTYKPGPYSKDQLAQTPMPLTANLQVSTDLIQSSAIHTYALAFIQKTSLTAADKRQGKSAYEIAVENGFKGSETEWLESLKGKQGPQGLAGKDGKDGKDGIDGKDGKDGIDGKDGEQGPPGEDGKSAYDIAVENGFKGSEQEWLDKLEAGSTIPVLSSTIINSKDTAPDTTGDYVFKNVTLRVYDVKSRALSVSFNTNVVSVDLSDPTEISFSLIDNTKYIAKLDELGHITEITDVLIGAGGEVTQGPRGDKGEDGKSAYDIAVEEGFVGDKTAWLESLKGEQGPAGKDGKDGEQGPAGQNGKDGADGKDGEQGLPGQDGKDGIDGKDGKDGEQGSPGEDGKSAYDIAVENGFIGSEEDWLASLQGEPGEQGETGKAVQKIEEFSEEEDIIIGRWIDKKPIKRRIFTLNDISVNSAGIKALDQISGEWQGMTMVNLIATAKFTTGDDKGILMGAFAAQLPALCDDIWFSIRYYPDESTDNFYLYANGLVDNTVKMDLTIIFEYVNPNDAELSDEDLIVDDESSNSEGGTSDHRELTHRDAEQQHPISAITKLSDRLAVRPSSAITNAKIDDLFK